MADQQDDDFARRRAELDDQFQRLPRPGTTDYWQSIERPTAEGTLPLEVLARCLRERARAGANADAARIYEVILGRVQRHTAAWAGKIASHAGAAAPQLAQDLQQECYLALWAELVANAKTFLHEAFMHALDSIERHVAHTVMRRAGIWTRRDVKIPRRVPRRATTSLDAPRDDGEGTPAGVDVPDPAASDAFAEVERRSDLETWLAPLSADERQLLYDCLERDLTQAQVAARLGVTDRTVRNRLDRIYARLRALYRGEEEHDHA